MTGWEIGLGLLLCHGGGLAEEREVVVAQKLVRIDQVEELTKRIKNLKADGMHTIQEVYKLLSIDFRGARTGGVRGGAQCYTMGDVTFGMQLQVAKDGAFYSNFPEAVFLKKGKEFLLYKKLVIPRER